MHSPTKEPSLPGSWKRDLAFLGFSVLPRWVSSEWGWFTWYDSKPRDSRTNYSFYGFDVAWCGWGRERWLQWAPTDSATEETSAENRWVLVESTTRECCQVSPPNSNPIYEWHFSKIIVCYCCFSFEVGRMHVSYFYLQLAHICCNLMRPSITQDERSHLIFNILLL
jgi:hypothetical protein